MALHHSLLLLSLLLLPICAVASVGRSGQSIGAWTPIKNFTDMHIKEIADFAVAEYNNRTGAKLKLEKVIHGETQVVAGVQYRLILEANQGPSPTRKYEAIVWEKPWEHFKNLTSFKPYHRRTVGTWKPIENLNDTHVKEIADFAVAEYKNRTGAKLKLEKVIKGESQVVAGVKYRLVLAAKQGPFPTRKYEAIVWEKPWENFRNLTSFKPYYRRVVGAWKPIENVNDPEVKEIAEFTVAEYNKKNEKKLKLVRVVKGEVQVVNGLNYRLVIAAREASWSSPTKKYEALVYDNARMHLRKLTWFKRLQA